MRAVIDHHVDRSGVEVWQHTQLTDTNRSIDLIRTLMNLVCHKKTNTTFLRKSLESPLIPKVLIPKVLIPRVKQTILAKSDQSRLAPNEPNTTIIQKSHKSPLIPMVKTMVLEKSDQSRLAPNEPNTAIIQKSHKSPLIPMVKTMVLEKSFVP